MVIYKNKSIKHLINPHYTDICHKNYERRGNFMFENEPDLLTRKQCQELLQISKSKILELIHEGWLPARKIARRFRIEKKI